MASNKLQSSLAIKLILGLAAFMICLLPLQIVLLCVPLNKWVALVLKLLCGHAGVIVLFKWLRKHPADQRPAYFSVLVNGAFVGAILYLALTAVKFLAPLVADISAWEGILNLVRVLCPAGCGLIGAWIHKE